MVGCSFCSAINCHNSKKKNKDKSFFSFPLNSDLSKRWVINTHREDLLYRNSQYLRSNCCLCSDHFEPQCFLNILKNRLNPDAVPTLFDVPNPPKELAPKRRKLTRTENIFKEKTELSDKGNKVESNSIYMQPVEETFEKENDLSYQQFSNYREVATQVESVIIVDQNTQTDAILTSYSPRKKQLKAKMKCLSVSMQQLKRKTQICKVGRKAHQNPKSLQQHPECSSCSFLKRSVSLDASENYYLYFKEYDDGHLVAPSNDFVNTIVELEKIFIDIFQKKLTIVV